MDDMKRNGSGYIDPTAYQAIKNEDKSRRILAKKCILTIQNVAHLAGFDIDGRIRLKDHKSGEIYK